MSVLDPLVRAWHLVRRPLTHRRLPYVLLNRLRPSRRGLIVDGSTRLVVEGPMRSGNTFTVAAIRSANADLRIARHLHAPAHILQAVHLGVPTIVLLRDPAEACTSHVIRRPALALADSLRDWIDYYRTLRPVRDQVVVAPFEVVIEDVGAVVDELNRRFGTSFHRYENTPENDAQVLRTVERMNRAEEPTGAVNEQRVARPSDERDERKAGLRRELEVPPNAELLAAARTVYADWMAVGVRPAGDVDQTPEDSPSNA
ncbi:MAG: hypothetical protein KY469_20220 [Actinobacteria bacterium]|nr:hypothetical protein [Actinomycetota bacterium]